MNFNLLNMPQRSKQPRNSGITMISDKGLNIAETENLLSIASPYIDFVKLAFGTMMVTPLLNNKLNIFRSYNIPVFVGGLLFEAFMIRNQLSDYLRMLDEYQIDVIEISDGALDITPQQKRALIKSLSKDRRVISKVGSKDKDKVKVTPPYQWIEMMQGELEAGAEFVAAESKESGTEGLYRDSGEVREGLVHEILTKIPVEKIIWETPEKEQQLYFIKLLGCNCNLGNISHKEVIPLETMRVGLRGDTFDLYLGNKG